VPCMSLDLGTLVAYVEADDTQYNRVLDRSEGRMSRFGGALATGLKVAGGAFLATAGAAGALGLRTAAANEQADISFTTMLGSAKEAETFLGKLGDFAKSTPFGFPELQVASQSLISAGINADKVIPIMTTLGNATSGMGTGAEGVKRATVALQQMNAAGKISGEDLNQLRDAGIPVYDLLAAATGKSTEKLADMASKGKLGRKELEQLMGALESGKGLEQFAGMMEAQSQSITGLWSTLKDEIGMGMATAIEPLLPLIKQGLGGAITFVSGNIPALRSGISTVLAATQGLYALIVGGDFTGKLREAFGWEEDSAAVDTILRIRDAAMGLYDLVVNGDFSGQLRAAFGWEEDSAAVASILQIRDAATGFFDSVREGSSGISLDGIGQILTQAAVGVGELMAAAPAVGPTFSLIGDALALVADNADLVGQALPYLLAGFAAFKTVQAANSVIGRDSAAGMVLQTSSTVALAASNFALAGSQTAANTAQSTGILTSARAATAAVATRVATLAGAAATGVATAAQWLWNAALTANPIGLVVLAIAALVAGLVYAWNNSETFRRIVTGAWDAIKVGVLAVVNWLKVAVPAVFQFVKNAFLTYTPLGIIISHWDQIRSFISGAVDRVKAIISWFAGLPGMFSDWFGRARDAINDRVAAVVTLVKGLPGRIISALGNLGSLLADKGRDLVSGLISGISGMAGRLAGFVKDFIVENIPGPIRKALDIGSPSRVAARLTRWVPLGAIEGLKETAPQLRRSVDDLFNLGNVSPTFGFSPALAGAAGSLAGASGAGQQAGVPGSSVIKHYRPVYVDRLESPDYGSFMDEVEETERVHALTGGM
jgi:tape measure domain-containing protein